MATMAAGLDMSGVERVQRTAQRRRRRAAPASHTAAALEPQEGYGPGLVPTQRRLPRHWRRPRR